MTEDMTNASTLSEKKNINFSQVFRKNVGRLLKRSKFEWVKWYENIPP